MRNVLRSCAILALAVFSILSDARATDAPYPQWPLPPTAPIMNLGRRGMPPPEEFGLFYQVWSDQPAWFNLDVADIPFRQDVALISCGSTPTYPVQGPHMIEIYPGGRAAFYAQLDAEITSVILTQLPMADYDGLLVYDYEYFCPNWTGHHNYTSSYGLTAIDADFIDDWRDTLRMTRAAALVGMTPAQQESYFRQEWLATTREFFTHCYNLAKQLRPNAKVSFYNQPSQDYWAWRDPAKAAAMRLGNEQEAAWFWDMIDAICPSVYPFYRTDPGAHVATDLWRESPEECDMYLRDNISEAIRVSQGKPVYLYVSFQYHNSNQLYRNQIVNDYDMRRPYEIAREMGCQGVVIWGWFQSQQAYEAGRDFYQQRFSPFLRQFSQLPTVPRTTPCTADLGQQGGLMGSDGILDANDFVSFIDLFYSYNYRADVGRQGGLPGADGQLDNNDFITFVAMFMSGCP